MAKRILGDEEKALWRAVMHDVAPLRACKKTDYALARAPKRDNAIPIPPIVADVRTAKRKAKINGTTIARPVPPPRPMPHVGVRAAGLDDTQWRRLSRGQMSVDARLDLHGYIVQDAFEAFVRFMHRSRGMGWRCVEIVTGLGSGARGGTIRKEVPLWLQRGDIAPMVLGVVHSHRGNQGALRLLLRKKR